jgi:hypothetical protein
MWEGNYRPPDVTLVSYMAVAERLIPLRELASLNSDSVTPSITELLESEFKASRSSRDNI